MINLGHLLISPQIMLLIIPHSFFSCKDLVNPQSVFFIFGSFSVMVTLSIFKNIMEVFLLSVIVSLPLSFSFLFSLFFSNLLLNPILLL
jgi:hypothetical protein